MLPYMHVCPNMDAVCMAYCAGGETLPRAKMNFYPSGIFPKSVPPLYGEGPGSMFRLPHPQAGTPVSLHEYAISMCMPPQACLGGLQCARGYELRNCAKCVFKYYRDRRKFTCIPCGWEQVMGFLIMSAATTFMTIGTLVFMMIGFKAKSDLKFKLVLITVAKTRVLSPIKSY